jgi:hypothetical protein
MWKLWLLVVAVAAALTAYYYATWQHWLAYATGSYNTQGTAHNYNAFSGSISDIGEITIVASVLTSFVLIWRSHTCHRYWWCWRHPHFALDGTPYKMCSKHHPDDVPTMQDALSAHAEAQSGD